MSLETHGALSQLCIFVQSMICLDNFFTLRACSLIRFMQLLFTLDSDRVDHYWYCYYLLYVASDTCTYKALFKMGANVSMAQSGRGSVGGGGWMGTNGPPPRGIKCQVPRSRQQNGQSSHLEVVDCGLTAFPAGLLGKMLGRGFDDKKPSQYGQESGACKEGQCSNQTTNSLGLMFKQSHFPRVSIIRKLWTPNKS